MQTEQIYGTAKHFYLHYATHLFQSTVCYSTFESCYYHVVAIDSIHDGVHIFQAPD